MPAPTPPASRGTVKQKLENLQDWSAEARFVPRQYESTETRHDHTIRGLHRAREILRFHHVPARVVFQPGGIFSQVTANYADGSATKKVNQRSAIAIRGITEFLSERMRKFTDDLGYLPRFRFPEPTSPPPSDLVRDSEPLGDHPESIGNPEYLLTWADFGLGPGSRFVFEPRTPRTSRHRQATLDSAPPPFTPGSGKRNDPYDLTSIHLDSPSTRTRRRPAQTLRIPAALEDEDEVDQPIASPTRKAVARDQSSIPSTKRRRVEVPDGLMAKLQQVAEDESLGQETSQHAAQYRKILGLLIEIQTSPEQTGLDKALEQLEGQGENELVFVGREDHSAGEKGED
ncbi:hypothetical protein NM208_g6087 [Fusarium decemcellulare]|uniref:Uncharacterized protein n=1 Tax=Fusarium decemcellulare TaxID=57161 RepID=A0ACC1SET4_9HYPO|nr:hypothetical protein NM208_g6087 [Fusarium decemcellulare]